MSFSNNIASRGGLHGWFHAHGHNAQGLRRDEQCRCGKDKKPSHIVCNTCWFITPPEVRHEFRHGDVLARRAAMRLLLEAAAGRRALRELNHP